MSFEISGEWVHVQYAERAQFTEVYGFSGTQGMVALNAYRAMTVDLVDANGSDLATRINPAYVTDQQLLQALQLILRSQGTRLSGTFGRAITSSNDALDVNIKSATVGVDPCNGPKRNVPISQTANAVLATAIGAGTRFYICGALIVGADAENVSVVSGTGATCGTNTAAVIGGTTAAAGPNLAANGGFQMGNGAATIAASLAVGADLCLFQSGSGRVAGNLVVVAAP